jgi:integrase
LDYKMPVYKDSRGRYSVEFCQGGRRIHRVCPPHTTKAQAVEWETKLRGEVFRVDKLGGLPEYSLQQGIDRYLDEYTGKDKSRVNGKCRQIAHAVVGRALGDVVGVASTVANDKSVSGSTRNRRLAILRRVANLAYKRWGWLKEPLGDKIQLLPENPPREVYLSKAQIKALAEAQSNVQVKAAIFIAAYTGLRSGEILALTPVDIRDGVIHVRTSKSGRPRMVPIVPAIRRWLGYLPIGTHPSTLSHAVSNAMPGVRFHDLRHSCASLLLAAGVDLYTISKILGHSSIQMTQRYSHLETKALKKAMRKIG